MVMDAMVKSKPISHGLSQRTINHLIEAGYHDIDKLHSSTWEERTMVLREGGYNRYREQIATNLGSLAEFVVNEYGMSICWFKRVALSHLSIFMIWTQTTADENFDRCLRRR
jgi:hypothetical protein